ncbi:MAG: hypothetical protein E5W30_06470, partial [Mesorhizobium sp.]
MVVRPVPMATACRHPPCRDELTLAHGASRRSPMGTSTLALRCGTPPGGARPCSTCPASVDKPACAHGGVLSRNMTVAIEMGQTSAGAPAALDLEELLATRLL